MKLPFTSATRSMASKNSLIMSSATERLQNGQVTDFGFDIVLIGNSFPQPPQVKLATVIILI
ncbi:hypothetical protein J6K59_01600 [Leuconostoc mesenteroides]|nr:hypothetical protein [Leuconostoc mesenteroides]